MAGQGGGRMGGDSSGLRKAAELQLRANGRRKSQKPGHWTGWESWPVSPSLLYRGCGCGWLLISL